MSSLSTTFQFTSIINRHTDLNWFIVAAASGYCLRFLNAVPGWDMLAIWFVWVTFIETPSLFAHIRAQPKTSSGKRP